VGWRIRNEILDSRRAVYGEEIVSTLSRQLSAEFGSGYSRPNLFHMIKSAESFPDREIVSTLSRQLSWSHFIEILQLALLERWLVGHRGRCRDDDRPEKMHESGNRGRRDGINESSEVRRFS
jgi:hypothetical protein